MLEFSDHASVIRQIKGVDYPSLNQVNLDIVRITVNGCPYDDSGDLPLLTMNLKFGHEDITRWLAGDKAIAVHVACGDGPDYIFVCDPRKEVRECIVGVQIPGKMITFAPLATSPEEAFNTARIASLPR